METKFDGERLQSRSGKQVTFKVTINRDGSMATWDGEVLLRAGVWHRLRGGVVFDVNAATAAHAVTAAFDRELDALDLEALTKSYGL